MKNIENYLNEKEMIKKQINNFKNYVKKNTSKNSYDDSYISTFFFFRGWCKSPKVRELIETTYSFNKYSKYLDFSDWEWEKIPKDELVQLRRDWEKESKDWEKLKLDYSDAT